MQQRHFSTYKLFKQPFKTLKASARQKGFKAKAVDPDPQAFSLLDPDPGGKNFRIKTEKSKDIGTGNNCKFIQFFKVNLDQLRCILLFSNLMFLQLKKTLRKVIFLQIF